MSAFDPTGLYKRHPRLAEIDDNVWLSAIDKIEYFELPSNTELFRLGNVCKHFYILLRGTARVYATDRQGREIVLYRIWPGDLCVVSLAALLQRRRYPANAIAENDLSVARLTLDIFYKTFDGSPGFRTFIVEQLSARLHDSIGQVKEIAFEKLDVRLANLLYNRFSSSKCKKIEITHNQLAMELGTSREVTSRMLKGLERRCYLQLHRGAIKLSDENALDRLKSLVNEQALSA